MSDVASILGITRESANRALTELRWAKVLGRVASHTYQLQPGTLH
jgi:DNA-binding IclR family transcriptional regulator